MKELTKCQLCGESCIFDAATISIISQKESGEIEPNQENISALIPLCAYHMVLAQKGLIGILPPKNEVVQSKLYTQLQDKTDKELKDFILKLKRSEKSLLNKGYKHAAKVIISARKFQEEMKAVEQ